MGEHTYGNEAQTGNGNARGWEESEDANFQPRQRDGTHVQRHGPSHRIQAGRISLEEAESSVVAGLFDQVLEILGFNLSKEGGENAPTGRDAGKGLGALLPSQEMSDRVVQQWDEKDIDALARTLYGEARSEDDRGMAAVGHVIMNRVRNQGKSIREVVKMPKQFSPWNDGGKFLDNVSKDDPEYKRARKITEDILGGRSNEDEVLGFAAGANHFYAPTLVAPKWGKDLVNTRTIGGHRFGWSERDLQ